MMRFKKRRASSGKGRSRYIANSRATNFVDTGKAQSRMTLARRVTISLRLLRHVVILQISLFVKFKKCRHVPGTYENEYYRAFYQAIFPLKVWYVAERLTLFVEQAARTHGHTPLLSEPANPNPDKFCEGYPSNASTMLKDTTPQV